MKRVLQLLLLLSLCLLGVVVGSDQLMSQNVNVAGALVGNGTYATLGAAFTAINGGAQTGAVITIQIVNNTTEAAPAVLNNGAWTSLSIQPSGGAARTVSGAIAAGSPLVDFAGADNVTVDGLNSGGDALTFANTTVSATSGTSTIRFQGDATNNVINRCGIQSSCTMAAGTGGGAVFVASGAVTTGNDNITISNCDIGPAGANLPSVGITCTGTSNTLANNGLVVTGNLIHDVFNATGATAGIYITTGTTDAMISNNKFYQAATRTQTTGGQISAIWIVNTGSTLGYEVTANSIGYATSAGTGATVYVMASASKVVPIFLSVGTTVASNANGNTITNISMSGGASGTTTAGPFRGIYIASGLANAGASSGNVIGSNTVNGAISYTSTSGTTSDIHGIYNFSSSSTNISNNVIGGFTVGNSGAGAASIYAIRVNTGAGVNSTISNNQIGGAVASSLQSTAVGSTASTVQGILMTTSNATVTGNVIASLSVQRGDGTGTAPSVGGIMFTSSSVNNTCVGNTISTLGNLNPTSVGHVTGIVYSSSTGTNLIAKNNIHSFVLASPTATMNGIFVNSGTATYANNVIRLGIDPSGASVTAGCAINGISEVTAGTDNFYHNSVYIGGSGVGPGAGNTFAFQSSITTNVRNYLNNIFVNERSNGSSTGKHYAIRVGGTAPNPAGLTTNYNVLRASGTGGFVGLFNAVDQPSIGAWQAATGQDVASFSASPNFVNPLGNALAVDLHINSPTPIEGVGTPVAAVTDDMDGQTRSGLTPVDIGADAGNFTFADVVPPSITYTPLLFTCATGDRTFTATISDATGIPTSGSFIPRIYYRKNAAPYLTTQGGFVSGTSQNSTWTFTIASALMGGVTTGDVISYYVIAQDLATPTPNVTSNPSTGLVASDVNTVTTHPSPASSYTIANTLAGTYTVGGAGVYPTLTAAINAYNTNCLGGPVIFELLDASYSEAGGMTIIKHPDASAVNTLTIRPAAGVTASVSATAASGALIRILGNYVTIDGSNNGSTSRNLTLTNLSTTAPSVVLIGSTGTSPITNTTLKNTIVINGIVTSSAIIVSDGASAGGAGYFNNISITNNDVQKAFIGIFNNAFVQTGNGTGLLINNNTLTTTGANSVRRVGIYVQGVDGATVTGNTVSNLESATAENDFGIWLASGTTNSTVSGNTISTLACAATGNAPTGINVTPAVANANLMISGNTVSGISSAGGTTAVSANGISLTGASSGVTITRNTITNIKNTSTTGWGACGILLGSTSTTANVLASNNFVSDVAGYGFNGSSVDDNGNGIAVTAGAGYSVYHNTVNMTGNQTLVGGLPAAVLIGVGVTTTGAVNLRNNIFNNGMTVGTERYAINSAAPNTVFAAIDYNDYFTTGPNLGLIGGTGRPNLAAVQTGFGGNVNSLNVAPVFVSGTDLHLVPASNVSLNNLGTPIGVVPVDIDLATRDVSTPDMGADEFDLPLCTGTPTAGTAALTPSTVCQGVPVNLSVTGYTSGVAGLAFQWMSSLTPGGPYTNIPGATTANYAYSTAPAGVNYIVCRVTCTNGGGNALTNEVSVTVGASPTVTVSPTTGRLCYPTVTPINLVASGSGGTGVLTYAWTPTTGLSSSTGPSVDALPFGNTTYTVTVSDANACTGTATAVISVGSAVTLSGVTATPSTICAGNTTALDVTATGGTSSTYTISTVPFAPIASGSGTTTLVSGGTAVTPLTAGTTDDGYWNGIALPFPFSYFGAMYGSIHVGTNGLVSFSPLGTGTGYGSSPQIPNTAAPNNIIGGTFGDLEWTFGGVISTFTSGTAPNRIFVIDYNGTTGGGWYNTGSAPTVLVNFQIQLHENGNLIQVQTTSTPTSTQNHTMGIENLGGTAGFVVTGRNNTTWSLSNDGTQFTPTPAHTYSWTPSLGLTPSATVKNPTTPALSGNTTYNVTVSESNGCSATGNVTVTVNPTVTPSVTISANPGSTICAGASVTFTATPVNGGASPTYQWQKNGGPVGTNSSTYTDGGLVNGDVITCIITSNATCPLPATATSNSITMTVNPLVTPSVTISATPGSSICAGTSVTFTAVPTNGGGTPSYQWLKNGSPVGTNSSTYTDAGLANGDAITCQLGSSDACASPTSATSNTITMVVTPVVTPSVSISANPGTAICAGTSVTFTAVPTNGGGSPSYQWLKNGGPVGTNSTTYTDAGLVNGDVITCVLTNGDACVSTATATSNALTISVVTNTTPSISISVSPGSTICPGSSATFSATTSNVGTTPVYQWRKNGGPVGTNSTSYTDGGLVTGDVISCVVTSSDPCALPATATSNSITMTVADLVNPTAVCQNVTVSLNGSGVGSTTAAAVNNNSSDNCTASGSLGLSLSSTSFTCSNLGSNTVTLTVTDGASRTSTCTATVTVVDAIAPSITCPSNITTGTGSGCNATVTYSTPSGTDNCTPTTVQTAGLATGATFPTGTTTNTFRVTDGSGNSSTCSFTVTVNDVTAPTATCQAVTVSLNGGGTGSTTAAAVNNNSTDNCTSSGSLGLALSSSSFNCSNLGTNTVTLTVTDGVGNTGTCSAIVTVVDAIAPAITCPSNQSATAATGTCGANVTYTTPVGTDNCTPTTTLAAGQASGSNFLVGTTTNTYVVTDGSGNTATCSFTVTVTDTELPTITCPSNVTASNDVGVCGAVVTYTAPNGLDNCTGSTTVQIAGLASGASFPVGTTTNTFRVTDGAGNSTTCSFDVTVNDTEAPGFTGCPTAASGTTGVTCDGQVTWTAPTGTDNCTVASTSSTANPGDTFPLGTTTVTYTATDGAGNTGTCSFVVTVTDATAPTALCAAASVTLDVSGNATIVAGDVDGGSSDACGSVTTSVSPSSFNCANVGANTVVLTVTDLAGNTSTCNATVTVSAQAVTAAATSPVVNCGYNVSCNGASDGTATVTPGGGCPTYTFLWSNGQTTATATGLGAGTHTVTVTDASGGTAVTTVTLTAPSSISGSATSTNSCPGDATGTADLTASGGNDCSGYSFLWSTGATTEDVSGLAAGTYTVTITDVSGCTGTASVTVGSFTAPAPTFTASGNLLTSNQTWSTYQWLLNGTPISGATNSTYTITATGNYSLSVTDANGCSGVSNEVNIVSKVDPSEALLGLTLYPNPARGSFNLLTAAPITQALSVRIYDMHGHKYMSQELSSLGSEVTYDIRNYSAGTYTVEVVLKDGSVKHLKLVVQ